VTRANLYGQAREEVGARAVAAYEGGASIREVAAMLGLSREATRHLLKPRTTLRGRGRRPAA
jgi:transposase